jgi:hypothetical protein
MAARIPSISFRYGKRDGVSKSHGNSHVPPAINTISATSSIVVGIFNEPKLKKLEQKPGVKLYSSRADLPKKFQFRMPLTPQEMQMIEVNF